LFDFEGDAYLSENQTDDMLEIKAWLAQRTFVLIYILMYFSKDDEELIVGRRLSRIVVAHPVLRGFQSATLLYTAYAGWISSGLAKWSVDSLSLTDSFGQQSVHTTHSNTL
jgi:hypothetical protein